MYRHTPVQLRRLTAAVAALIDQARAVERNMSADIEQVEPDYRDSARNLVHYMAVRQHDLRELQENLSALGLSSLGRMEAHVMATLQAVYATLRHLGDEKGEAHVECPAGAGFRTGPLMLRDHAERLLGTLPRRRNVRIMVTMPSEAALEPSIIANLLAAGMNVMRVNCAHDSPDAWHAMLDHLDVARRNLNLPCRVLADLSGPKLRTGPVMPGPAVVRVKPQRDVFGRVTRNANIWLTPADASETPDMPVDQVLPLEGPSLDTVVPGDCLRLVDTRGRRRRLYVTRVAGASRLAECDRTLYVGNSTDIVLDDEDGPRPGGAWTVAMLSPLPAAIELRIGDQLIVTKDLNPDAEPNADGPSVARIGCSLPEVFDSARSGEPIWFDDGKIGGRIESNDGERLTVTITQGPPRGARLRAEKGINLPDTLLNVGAVTARDLEALATLAPRIDMAGLSFVRDPEDVLQLEEHLHALGAERLGIVLKIENRLAFERLPRILLAGMRSPPIGVMVARGDLAVEIGYERLAEMQEEILWMCEAAHVPVIWATQVLENMATKGTPTRAEVTDAAMSGRAECVMLNKGPYVLNAVDFLSGVLERMEEHQSKKSARLRQLRVSTLL